MNTEFDSPIMKTVVKFAKPVQKTYKSDLEADMCYHWCVAGRHDWSHKPSSGAAKMDEWRKDCDLHRRLGGTA